MIILITQTEAGAMGVVVDQAKSKLVRVIIRQTTKVRHTMLPTPFGTAYTTREYIVGYESPHPLGQPTPLGSTLHGMSPHKEFNFCEQPTHSSYYKDFTFGTYTSL